MTLRKTLTEANARAQRSESFARARGRRRGVTRLRRGDEDTRLCLGKACVPHCVLQRIAPRARAVIDACNFPATGVPLDRLAHARKVEFAEADPTRRESNRTR